MKWAERRNVLIGCIAAIVLLLGGRLFYMQVIRSDEYRRIATENRIRILPLPATRGAVFDRHGQRLIKNRPSFAISVLPSDFRGQDSRYRLARILDIKESELSTRISRHTGLPMEPVGVYRDADFRAVCRLQEHLDEFPGVIVGSEHVREYPTAGWAGHILGYVRDVSPNDRTRVDRSGSQLRGLVGAVGIEKQYDEAMRGVDGVRYLQMNALGQLVGSMPGFDDVPATPGSDLMLTLDLELQNLADSLLSKYDAGTVVALHVATGGVLCFVTRPGFNANSFSGVLSPEEWNRLKDDPRHPLLNRAIKGLYSPGSAAKLTVAAVALEKGVIRPGDRLGACTGGYQFGNRWFGCWKAGGHGTVNLIEAIERSCNVYFYQLIQKIPFESWTEGMLSSGFGHATGIDLAGESNGLVPSKAYYDERYGKGKWSRGLLLNLSIGQGEFLATPLQLVLHYAALGNHGIAMKPHLLKASTDDNGVWRPLTPEVAYRLPYSNETLAILREAARRVVSGEHGTARGIDDPLVRMAGKTGTAQNPHGKEHAWFVGYAPVEAPEIAVVALVENAGHGSEFAAPICLEIARRYLNPEPVFSEPVAAGNTPHSTPVASSVTDP